MTSIAAEDDLDEIVGGLDVAKRWGVEEGQLAARFEDDQQPGAINRVVRQYIDGEVDAASDAVAKMNDELGAIE